MNDHLPLHIDADSRGFWQACARGELAICACPICDLYVHPPVERCPSHGHQTELKVVSGNATLFSYIVVQRAVLPGSVPGELIGLVELVEQAGLRIPARLVDLAAENVRIGMPLQVRFIDDGEARIPVFGPASLT